MLPEIRGRVFRPASRLRRRGFAKSSGTRQRAARRLLLEQLEDRRLLAAVRWVSDADGFWDDATNWADEEGTQRVPAAGDDVVIDRPDQDLTITYRTGNLVIDSLTSTEALRITSGNLTVSTADVTGLVELDGGNLRFTGESETTHVSDVNLIAGGFGGSGGATVSGQMNWTGGNLGLQSASGVIDVRGELLIDGPEIKRLNGVTVNNHGHVILDGEHDIVVTQSSTFNNMADGTFEIRVDQGIARTNGTLAFHNHGLLVKSAGDGSSNIFRTTVISTHNHDGATIRVESGQLLVRPVGNGGGTWEVAEGATLRIENSNYQGEGASLFAEGEVHIVTGVFGLSGQVDITGRTSMTGGSFRLNGAAESSQLGEVFLEGGRLGGSGGGTILGPMHWTGGGLGHTAGTIDLIGETFVDGDGEKHFTGGTINNHGHVILDGEHDIVVTQSSTFNNLADGTFEIRVDQGIDRTNGVLAFHNHGLLVKSAGDGSSNIISTSIGTHNHDGGTIRVDSGQMRIRPVGDGGGTWEVAEGSTLRIENSNYQGIGASLFAEGDVRISTGAFGVFGLSGEIEVTGRTFVTGHFSLNGEADTTQLGEVFLEGGQLGGSGGATINGPLHWTGGGLGHASGTIDLLGETFVDGDGEKRFTGGTINNHGHFHFAGENHLRIAGLVTFHNQADGIFDVRTDFGIGRDSHSMTFHNHGLLVKSEGTGTSSLVGRWGTVYNVYLDNHEGGTVRAESGRLTIRPVGSGGGTWEVAAGSTLRLENSQYEGEGASLFAEGDVQVAAGTFDFFGLSGEVEVTGRTFVTGNFRLNGEAETTQLGEVFLQGGRLGGSGGTTINGPLHWTGGGLGHSGVIDLLGETFVDGDAVKYFTGGTINNHGYFHLAGEANMQISSVGWSIFNNHPEGIFDIQVDKGIGRAGGSMVFNNHGLFVKSAGDGQSSIVAPWGNTANLIFENHAGGTVRIQSGTLRVTWVLGDGAWDVQSTLQLVSILGAVRHFGPNAQIDVSGTLRIEGRTDIDGTLDVTGRLVLSSSIARLNIHGELVNLVDGTLSGGDFHINHGQLHIPENVRNLDTALRLTGTRAFVRNAANQNALTGLETISPSGRLTLDGGRNLTVGSLENAGILEAHSDSPLTVSGQYVQTQSGIMRVQIGGDPESGLFSRYHITGAAHLDGRLEVALVDGFGPLEGQQYGFMRFAEQSGNFAEIDGLRMGSVPVFERLINLDGMVLAVLVDATDLAAVSIIVPEEGVPGESVTISYTVENRAEPPALGEWVDSLYLSTGSQLTTEDRLIARIEHEGPVAGGTSYTNTVETILPAGAEANYRVILVTDSRGLVPDSDRTNNQVTSVDFIRARVPVLEVGGSVVTPIQYEDQIYYRVDVPPGGNVRITADLTQAGQANLYASYRVLPDRVHYDIGRTDVSSTQHEILLSGRAGAWYLMLRGREWAEPGEVVTLSAEAVGFELFHINPQVGSNLGHTNIRLSGAGFTIDSEPILITPDGVIRQASDVFFVSQNTINAAFDLTGLEDGLYQVQVIDGSSTTESRPFRVNDGGTPGRIEYELTSTKIIRALGIGSASVKYENVGDTPVPFPLLGLATNRSVMVPDEQVERLYEGGGSSALDFLGLGTIGTWELAPGASGQQLFPFRSTRNSLDPIEFSLGIPANPNQPLGWGSIRDTIRPPLISSEAWDALFENFQAIIGGGTQRDLEHAISRASAYLTTLGQETGDTGQLIGFLLQQANHAIPGGPLTMTTDASAPSSVLPLFLSRTFHPTITARNTSGLFGRGWLTPFDVVMHPQNSQGVITIEGPGFSRGFERVEIPRVLFGIEFKEILWRGLSGDLGEIESDAHGQPAFLRDPDGRITFFNGPDGRISGINDTNNRRLTFEYSDDQLTRIQHSGGFAFDLEYHDHGNVARLIDHEGRVTNYSYDDSGEYLIEVDGPLGMISYSYEQELEGPRRHALTSLTRRDGSTAVFEYNELGRLTQIARPDGTGAVGFSYEHGLVRTTTSQGTTSTFFNAIGQAVRVIDPIGQISSRRFDDQDRIIEHQFPGNLAVGITYNAQGLPRTLTDAIGNTVTLSYREDHVSPQQQAQGVTSFGSRLSGLEDQLGRLTTFEYNALGNRTRITYPDGTFEAFTVNDQGQVVGYRNRLGETMAITHNTLGNVVRRQGPGNLLEVFTHDDRGNLLTASNAHGTTTFEYDARNRMTFAGDPAGRFLRYSYNDRNQITSLEDQDGNITNYEYDALGRPERITDTDDNLILAYEYDQAGRIVLETRGNGTTTAYAYDSVHRLTQIVHAAPDGEILEQFGYQYDTLGHRTAVSTIDGLWTYSYDAIGQLTEAVFNSTNPEIPDQELSYEYDAAGNRTRSIANGHTTFYAVNNRNQYTLVGDAVHTYDAEGNLLSVNDGTSETIYIYSETNRLISVVSPEGVWQYEYDALGHRIATIHNGQRTEHQVDPTGLGDVVAEYDAAGNLIARYTHGVGLGARFGPDGQAAYYHYDAIGSTVALTGADGSTLNQYRYLPYGQALGTPVETLDNPVEAIDNPFQFVGRFGVQREGHGLDFMRARYYSSETGRFLNEDPIRHAGGLNLYQYAANQPTQLIDPSGLLLPLLAIPAFAGAGGAVVGGGVVGGGAAATFATGLAGTAVAIGIVGHWLSLMPEIGPEDPTIPDGEPVAEIDGIPVLPDENITPLPAPVANPDPAPQPRYPTHTEPRPLSQNQWQELYRPRGRSRMNPGMFSVMTPGLIGTPTGLLYTEWGSAIAGQIPGVQVASATTNVVFSFDPNDIIGPEGFGPEGFLKGQFPLDYMIRFENLDEATAPAVEVFITQQLDPDLDFTTFELGSFGFSDQIFTVPSGRDYYTTRLDLTDTLGLLVDFEAGINMLTGEAFWTFRALEPETLDLPMDPLAGFLPPNVTAPEGEGFVTYSIRTRAGLPTGTRIDAEASIVFDTNDPIETPPIFNTIDAGPPTSRVEPLEEFTYGEQVVVSWGGEDDPGGSGIRQYDVYVSADGDPFEIWLAGVTEQSAHFVGQIGSGYAFYSLAVDQVGRAEAGKASAEAETVLIPIPWTNPSNRYDVNGDGQVTARDALIVINAIGRHGGVGPVYEFTWAGFYLDVSQDGIVSALDALLVINQLTRVLPGGGGAGEGEAQAGAAEGESESQDRVVDSPGMSAVRTQRTSESRSRTGADRPIGPAGFGAKAFFSQGWDDRRWDDEGPQRWRSIAQDRQRDRSVIRAGVTQAGDAMAREVAIRELFGREQTSAADGSDVPAADGDGVPWRRIDGPGLFLTLPPKMSRSGS